MKLSILIPVYNEEKTVYKIVSKIHKLKSINKEIILIDDSSTDGTHEILGKLKKKVKKIIYHKKNLGKGAAIKTGRKYVTGDIIIIQDADLEYYPSDYYKLIKPIINGKSKVVYGSRVLGRKKNKNFSKYTSNLRIFANFVLTKISNIINNQNLSDAHTCYKVFDSKIFKKIKLVENDFAFCPEITSKISNLGINIMEIPIKYTGRSFEDGKKIKLRDAFLALKALFIYGFLKLN